MAYVTTAWGRPIQGVSQQPDRVRLEGQCTKQENAIPDVVRGLTKRPASNFIAQLLNRELSINCAFHNYDRGDEQYFLIVEPNSNTLSVYNLMGELQNISVTHGSYLNTPRPDLDLDFLTVADFTFITNKKVAVTMKSDRSPNNQRLGIVYSQYATYGKTYSILIDGNVVASYTTPDGSNADQIKWVATDYVALNLYTKIAGGTIDTPGTGSITYPKITWINASLHNNVIWIELADGSDFKLTTSDSQKGEDLIAAKGSIKQTTALPPIAPTGFTLRVTGSGKSSKDDYWLKADNSNDSVIRWVETVQPGVLTSFNPDTMPHTLVRDSISGGVANFLFSQGAFESRTVGGNDSNPLPAFINEDVPQPILSTGVFQNRLFFLSGESICMSRSNLFFNFWKETSQTSSDSDPIEGYADTDRVNNLYNYQVLNGDLALFSDNAQFVIDGSKPVTKSNITLEQVTAYPSEVNIKPQAAGENVFFAYNAANYVGVRELFTDNYSDTKKAYPITDYVSKYIPGRCREMLASPNLNTMMIMTYEDLNKLYIYDWLWQDNQKVQSAWHTWVMDGDVLYIFYIDDQLYILYKVNGKTYLDSLTMLNDPDTINLNYSTKLDHKVSVKATYNSSNGKYTFSLPYDRSDVVCTISSGGHREDEGSAFLATYLGNSLWETQEDLSLNGSDLQVICGVRFKYAYIPTQPVVKDFRERVIGLSSIIMSNLIIRYEVTGDIRVTATPKNGQQRAYHFSGRYMGTSTNLVGSPVLDNGSYRVPIRQRAEDMQIEIWSDSHYPLTIRDMEMDGTFHQRGQRI